MRKLFTLILASVIGFGTVNEANAQFNTLFFNKEKRDKGSSNWYKRIDIGGHYFSSDANTTVKFGNYDLGVSNPSMLHFGYSKDYNATGMGGRIGLYIPMTRTFRKASVNLSIAAHYTMVTHEVGEYDVHGQGVQTQNYDASMVQIPVGLDLKWGGESTLDKKDWATVSLGAGVLPSYHMVSGVNGADATSKFTVRPYAKAEAGFTTGIHWKFYVLWSLGTDRFLENSMGDLSKPLSNDNKVTLESTGKYSQNVQVGLAFSIGSLFWDKKDKW